MAAVLEKNSITSDSPGMEQRRLDGATFTSFEAIEEMFGVNSNDTALFKAAENVVTYPQVIGWSVATKNSTLAAGATSAAINTGVANIYINGTQVYEWRIQGASQHMITSPSGWEDLTGGAYPANGLTCFGNGITVTSGQNLELRVTPASATRTLWRVSFFGVESGAAAIENANFLTYSTTADQVALLYTPAADMTLYGFEVTANQIGNVCGYHVVKFNGTDVGGIIGYAGMDNTCPHPFPNATFGSGGIWINTWGMKMFPGDSIGYAIGKNDAGGCEWHQFVFGKDVAMTEGAGSNTYSRSRVVNA